MSVIETIREKAKTDVKHIVLPEGSEERTVQAAQRITEQGIARVTLIGDPGEIQAVADKVGVCLQGVDVIDPKASADYPRYCETFAKMRAKKGVTLEQAVMVPDMMCTAFEGVRQLDPAFGASVAVLGIGPVGLMAVRAAVLRGAGKVFAIGSRKGCFEVAQAYGATHLVDYHHENYLQQILAANGGPVDGVVLCGGAFASDPAVMGWLFQQ